jgi:hypothetical protein
MMTAAQLCTMAAAVAKVPSWTAQAGVLLNAILQELCQDYDLQIARKTASFSFNSAAGNQSGPYTLPSDWLRADRDDVFYTITGVKYVMIPIELAQYNAKVQQAGLNAYPSEYAVDRSPNATQQPSQMFVWVPPAGSYPVTLVYWAQMADIATPDTSTAVPWFDNQLYMLRRLTGEMMTLADDDRAAQFLGGESQVPGGGSFLGAAAILDRYLKQQGDSQVVKTVTLDRRRFGTSFSRLPNTKTVGW